MHPEDRERIVARYDARIGRLGAGIEGLASGTEARRALRFDTLLEIGVRSGDRVLDLGCGFGDLLGHCHQRGLDVDYVGMDINPSILTVAAERWPTASFVRGDGLGLGPDDYDWVLSTSTFNLRLQHQDNYAAVAEVLASAQGAARRGVAIDFMSSYADFYADPEVLHYEPERIFGIARQLTKRVCLRHDYPLFEFCVYLYPDFQGWATFSVSGTPE